MKSLRLKVHIFIAAVAVLIISSYFGELNGTGGWLASVPDTPVWAAVYSGITFALLSFAAAALFGLALISLAGLVRAAWRHIDPGRTLRTTIAFYKLNNIYVAGIATALTFLQGLVKKIHSLYRLRLHALAVWRSVARQYVAGNTGSLVNG